MIDDKTEDSPKVLLAAGGERGVIRILDIHRKSQYTAVGKHRWSLGGGVSGRLASTNGCDQSFNIRKSETESSMYSK